MHRSGAEAPLPGGEHISGERRRARANGSVLFVHGIGNQAEGSVVADMGGPTAEALERLAKADGWTAWTDHGSTEKVTTLERDGRRWTIRFDEAVWSSAFTRPDRGALTWMLARIPALVLVFLFDARDEAGLNNGRTEKTLSAAVRALAASPRRYLRGEASELGVLLRMLWRILLATGAVIIAINTARWLWQVNHLAFLVLAALLLYLALRWVGDAHANVTGCVRMASQEGAAVEQMQGPIIGKLDQVRTDGLPSVVVAHSQGGYLVHRVLTRTRTDLSPEQFIALGSGLKPISLLRRLQARRTLVEMWVAVLAWIVGMVALALSIRLDPVTFAQAVAEATARVSLAPIQPGAALRATDRLADLVTPGPLLVTGALGYLIALILLRILVGRGLALQLRPIREQVGWSEWTSVHDVVGRLLLPTLPQGANSAEVELGGNPLLDHTAYYKRYSVVPWLLAERILTTCAIPVPCATVPLLAEEISRVAARRRRFVDFLVRALVGLIAVTLVLTGMGLLALLPVLAVTSVALAVPIGVVRMIWERRHQGALIERYLRRGDTVSASLYEPRSRIVVRCWAALSLGSLMMAVVLARSWSGSAPPSGPWLGAAALVALAAAALAAGYRVREWVVPAVFAGVLVAERGERVWPVALVMLLVVCWLAAAQWRGRRGELIHRIGNRCNAPEHGRITGR